MKNLEITSTPEPPHDLLLLADESETSVADYIGRGTSYIARLDGKTVGEYVLLHTRPFTAEIVNIAVAPGSQRQGIGTALIAHAIRTAREAGFHVLEIATGDVGVGQIALYKRCGFLHNSTEQDYFRKYYPTPIFENGVECRHMVRMRMEL